MANMVNFKRISDYNSHGDNYVLVSFELIGISKELREKGYPTKMFGTVNKKLIQKDGTIMPGTTLISLAWGNTPEEAIENRESRYCAINEAVRLKIY